MAERIVPKIHVPIASHIIPSVCKSLTGTGPRYKAASSKGSSEVFPWNAAMKNSPSPSLNSSPFTLVDINETYQVEHLSSQKICRPLDDTTQDAITTPPKARLGAKTSVHQKDQDQEIEMQSLTKVSSKGDDVKVEEVDIASDEVKARYRRNGRIQFAALCWLALLIGWNDGTTGPLLPRLQQEYNVRIWSF